jgi:hypothetical protein
MCISSTSTEYNEHPGTSISAVSKLKLVPKSTLSSRINGTHAPRGLKVNRNLSIVQEDGLIKKINNYANRGTLLEPRHVRELAEGVCGHHVGVNWVSSFLHRHKSEVSSKYFGIQESARIKADTPEHRRGFYHQVSTRSVISDAETAELAH